MKFSAGSLVALLGALSSVSAAPECPPCRTDINTPEHYARMAKNYLNLWGGDYSLLNSTLSPEMTFSADIFPSGNGTTTFVFKTPTEFLSFVQRVRMGWDKYGFEIYKSAGSDYNVFIRWRLEGVVGSNFPPQVST